MILKELIEKLKEIEKKFGGELPVLYVNQAGGFLLEEIGIGAEETSKKCVEFECYY